MSSVPSGSDVGLMFDVAFEALLLLDQQQQVLDLNSAARELFGAAAVIGAPLNSFTDSSDLVTVISYVLENQDESLEVQTVIDGRFYRVRASQRPGVVPPRVGVALLDVTDLVRLNRARRDMVANISHELRTPIANIRLIIDSLFHEEEKPKRKKSIASLRAIARETDSLLWLVQELLDLSMIESGQAILRMVEVPLVEIVEDVLERMDEQAERREVRFVSQVDRNMRVLCDRDLASRVLINLIHNALKYSPKGGDVTVSAQVDGENTTITVQDNGPGVPADQTERIFERFYQVDGSRSQKEGTGLGLAICRHIVEAHGGMIWAESATVANGGRFRFTLLSAE